MSEMLLSAARQLLDRSSVMRLFRCLRGELPEAPSALFSKRFRILRGFANGRAVSASLLIDSCNKVRGFTAVSSSFLHRRPDAPADRLGLFPLFLR